MKLITAIFKPSRLDAVIDALSEGILIVLDRDAVICLNLVNLRENLGRSILNRALGN